MGWVRRAPECMGWEEEGTRRMEEEEEEDGRKGPLFILEGVDPPTGRKEGPRDQKDREAEEGKGKQPSKQGCDSEIDKQTGGGGGGGGTGSVDGGGAFGRREDSPPLSFGSFPASTLLLLPFLTATLPPPVPSSILHGLRSQPRSSVWPKSGGVGRSVGVSNGRPSNLHPYFAWPPRNPLFLREERKEGGPLVASSSSSLCPSVRPSPPPPPSTDLLFPPSSVGCSLHFPSPLPLPPGCCHLASSSGGYDLFPPPDASSASIDTPFSSPLSASANLTHAVGGKGRGESRGLLCQFMGGEGKKLIGGREREK